MKPTTILFDLDGTLIPMDQDAFIRAYIGGIAATAAKHGYDPTLVANGVMAGTRAMFANDGTRTNEEAFWQSLAAVVGEGILLDRALFDEYYEGRFDEVSVTCGHEPRSREIIDLVHSLGYTAVLATNPLFPAVATAGRIRWAGLSPDDFALVTSYENSHFCKPKLDYYREILARLGLTPEECVMVGNDVDEDMIAKRLGMRVFLLTDGLLNRSESDYSDLPHGSFDALSDFIRAL